MKVLRTVGELRSAMSDEREAGHTVGLVPTMGALHAGHMSLIDTARNQNDIVVASVFVNPTQFNNPDDLRTYPRTEDADCALLQQHRCDYAFIPEVKEMYPSEDTRVFPLGSVAEVMEGAMRPGHFNGVAQIVSKLFAMVAPDRAYFGEKDFQQIAVIRRMVELEKFPVEIVPCPIKRENDGLALSSRNVRLTPEGRKNAPAIHRILTESARMISTQTPAKIKKWVTEQINQVPTLETEYYEIADAITMQPVDDWESPNGTVGCVTVYCGDVRLIDNILYTQQQNR